METIAVVLEAARASRAPPRSTLTPPAPTDVVVDVEWSGDQHRHRAAALVGPHAALPGHGLSAGARLRVGRPRASRPAPQSGASRRASASSFPAPAASARCAACSAAPPPAWSCPAQRVVPIDEQPGRARRAAGAGRDRLSRASRRAARGSPSCIVGHGVLGPAAGPARGRGRRRPPIVWETQPGARAAVPIGYRGHRSRPTTRGATIARIYDVSGDAGLLDTLIGAPRAGRRDRARRLLQRAARPSPSRPPSCARRASASPPNGSRRTWSPSRR